jgi:hypothetical protein
MILQHTPQADLATRRWLRYIMSPVAVVHPAIAGKILEVPEASSPSRYLQTGEPGLPIGSSPNCPKTVRITKFTEQSR